MWSRKRPLLLGYENEPSLCTKKPLTGLNTSLGRCEAAHVQPSRSWASHLEDTKCLFDQISSWADTQCSVSKVLQLFKFGQASSDIFLPDSVNEKFLAFHRDITEECGAEDKQHSWAVIEKREEIVMYGPYYPNYSSGEHSEDTVIKQTQELLGSEAASDWKVYVFTMNSPCLARNTDPCMLNLVRKAHEWWRLYGVKTHVGYGRCWGFKGNKENVFRDINYQQVDCVNQTEDYEAYVKTAEMAGDISPLCERLYSAAKHLLDSGHLNFPLTDVQGQDWKNHFKSMHSRFEDEPEEVKNVLTQEANALIEAARARLPEKHGSLEGYLEIGKEFALVCTFGPQVSKPLQEEMTLTFQQCWREMVRDKYAEFIREKLTEDFNRWTVELFIKDVVAFTKEYLQMGKIQFSENDLVTKGLLQTTCDAE